MTDAEKTGSFIGLFPRSTRVALAVAVATASFLAIFDFLALLLLLPVFGDLTSDGSSSISAFGPFKGMDSGVLLTIAMGFLIFRTSGAFIHRLWWGQRVANAELALSSRLMRAYAYAPYEFHLKRNSTELLSRAVARINMLSSAGLNSLVALVADTTTVLAMTAALFVASPQAAAAVTGYLVVIAAVFVLVSRKFVSRQARRLAEHVSKVYERGATVLRGIRELTVADGRDGALRSVEDARRSMVKVQRQLYVLNDIPRLILETALYVAILIALLTVLSRPDSAASLPVVALYVVAGLRVLPAIARLLSTVTQFRTARTLGQGISEELGGLEAQGTQHRPVSGRLPAVGVLEARDLTFAYVADGDEAPNVVLDRASFAIPFGAMVGVVGVSGAGKSTLLGLLLGLLEPRSGSITFGGEAIGLADRNWLQHVGYVPQDVFILDDTVLNNVALGDESPDRAKADRALERAALAETVAALAEGLDTNLGEGGSRLSVGQRQRLGIARALYREPSVLILDEPTAALDIATETSIMETINDCAGEVTIVMVAHRITTLARVDHIIEMGTDGQMEFRPADQRPQDARR